MKVLTIRKVVWILSVCYLLLLACATGAEISFQRAVMINDVGLLKMAQQLNPLVSDYFYEDYRLTGDIAGLVQAMRLEPTKAAYHMYYGLALFKQVPRTRASDQEAVEKICKAAELKHYSKEYRQACDEFKAVIPLS